MKIAQDMAEAWIQLREAVENLQKVYEKHKDVIDSSLYQPSVIPAPFEQWVRNITWMIRDWEYLRDHKDDVG